MENKIYQMLKDVRSNYYEPYFRGEENEYVEVQQLCDIKLPTGKIVANDPLAFFEYEPFSIQVTPGTYPVYLYIYHVKTDSRVAFAEIRFSENIPLKYQFAVNEKFDKYGFRNIKYCNYGVDSGTGCFMDYELINLFQNYTQEQMDDLADNLQEELEETYIHTYSTFDYTPEGATANIVGFSSGWGDGGYASYRGYDEYNNICSLITSFDVLNFDYEFTNDIHVFKNVLDNGYTHNKKIKTLSLDTDSLAGYNHVAIFLRWMSEHNLLSEKLLNEYPELPNIIKENKVDLRLIIKEVPLFAHRLALVHFNDIGQDFAREFYVFGKQGYPTFVDQYAEKILGTEKYNSEECKNEAYLFVPYDEDYYHGLSKYIDEAFEQYSKIFVTSSPFSYDEKYNVYIAEINKVKFECVKLDMNVEMRAFELANWYHKKLKNIVKGMINEVTSFYGDMSEEDLMNSLGKPTINLDNELMTYTEHTLDDIHVIDVEFDGNFDEILEVSIDG